MRVTFDSNVWRVIASPNRFRTEGSKKSIKTLLKAIKERRILPCLAEPVFTLEAIKRMDRKDFLSGYKPNRDIKEKDETDGSTSFEISIGPDRNYHPGSRPPLSTHLKDALNKGFRILRCPRIAGFVNPDLHEEDFIDDEIVPIEKRQERFFECLDKIERRGCGISHIKSIGYRYSNGKRWHDGIPNAPKTEEGAIAKALAEWADGDSLAAHVAYNNDYFCTRDVGKSGGTDSILSEKNRKWAEEACGVVFLTREE